MNLRWSGRLLDELEQGVEALRRHHVGLVDDVDLEAARDRREERLLAQVAGVVDAAVARRVDLDDVDAARPVRGQLDAGAADAARLGRRPLLAVQRAGEDAGAGRLAAAARPAEQVGVVDLVVAQRLLERLGDVLLPDHLGEGRRAVLAVQGEGHGGHPMRRPRTAGQPVGRAVWRTQGTPRAPARAHLPLLPSGPGGVQRDDATRGVGAHRTGCARVRPTPAITGRPRPPVSSSAEDSHSGRVRTLGKRVGGNLSRVQIPHPPPSQEPQEQSGPASGQPQD